MAEPGARDVHRATLFVPEQARGIVEAEQGTLRVHKVLVPITSTLAQQPMIDELLPHDGALLARGRGDLEVVGHIAQVRMGHALL